MQENNGDVFFSEHSVHFQTVVEAVLVVSVLYRW